MIKTTNNEKHLVECKYIYNQEVTINIGIHKGTIGTIQDIIQNKETIIYEVKIRKDNKDTTLTYQESQLEKVFKFKIPFIK